MSDLPRECSGCGQLRTSFVSADSECVECLRDGMERLGEPLDWTDVEWSTADRAPSPEPVSAAKEKP
jgi:hypothetical protein